MKMLRLSILTLLVILSAHLSVQQNDCSHINRFLKDSYDDGYFELMNSPILLSKKRQQLRVVFDITKQANDEIAVFDKTSNNIVYSKRVGSAVKYIDTGIVNNPNKIYSALYIRENGAVVKRSSFLPWSGWMYCMKQHLEGRSLSNVFLPGTHDSGAYRRASSSNPFGPFNDIVFNQDETIEEQLNRGARYLDMRVARYKNTWTINHGIVQIRPLKTEINAIKRFLQRWPQEIIVLDFHEFPVGFGKGKSVHHELAQYLKNEFGSLIHKPNEYSTAWKVTLRQIWESQARIVLSYNDDEIAYQHNFYPPIKQIWAGDNVVSKEKLFKYIQNNIPRSCNMNNETAVMGALTPTKRNIIFDVGLRGLANRVNADISIAFARSDWGDTCQALAVDYLSSSGIISVAIYQNYKRAQPNHVCH